MLSERIPKPLLLLIDGHDICRASDYPDQEVVSILRSYEFTLRGFLQNSIMSRKITTIFCYLRRLSKTDIPIVAAPRNGVRTADDDNYQFLEYVENRIIALFLTAQTASRNPRRPIIVSFCLASYIYLYAVIRNIPLMVPYYACFITRLQTALQEINFAVLDHSVIKNLLWIPFVGRLAAHGRSEQNWFEQVLRELTRSCGLSGMATMDLVFGQLLWPKSHSQHGDWTSTVKSMGLLGLDVGNPMK
jgi:hypothetical protein